MSIHPHQTGGTVVVEGLKIYAYHGVLPQEGVVGNIFELNIRLNCQCAEALHSDSLSGTINYAVVVDIAKKVMQTPSALLEHVAYRLADALMEHFPVITGGTIEIYKPAPPIPAEIGRVGFCYSF